VTQPQEHGSHHEVTTACI